MIDLNGTWEFRLGGQKGGIQVPGCWEAQGYDKRHEGPAVYRRSFTIPEDWAGRPLALRFGAVSYHAEVAIDGETIGAHRGMWDPFALPLPANIGPGPHELAVTVYKPGERFPVREALAGFLPDVCTTFGGLWQPVHMAVLEEPRIAHMRLRPDARTGTLALHAEMADAAPSREILLDVLDSTGRQVAEARAPAGRLDMAVNVPGWRRWSPEDPALYTARLRLEEGGSLAERRFGFRRLDRKGSELRFNGAPVCLRGLLHWGWYPDRICPTPDAETIRSEFRRARAMGYNMIKLCLWVPPPLYFDLADEEGMFLWLELPMWLPQVTPALRAQAPVEYDAILARVQHHPSVVVYSLGCELNRSVDAELLGRLDGIARRHTRGVLLCDNSGSGEAYGGLSTDFADFSDYHFYCDIHQFNPLVDHFRRDWQPPRPWIFGEFCDSDDYRDPEELRAAHGGETPWWWTFANPIHSEIRRVRADQRARADATGWSDQALQRTSRRTAHAVRKAIIEKVRRCAGAGGYVITSFRDTPIATSAPFDDLGRAKCDLSHPFNADTVLVLDQGRARTWKHGGDRPRRRDLFNHVAGAPIDLRLILAHTGPPLDSGVVRWQVTDASGDVLAGGEHALQRPVEGGCPHEVAHAAFQAPEVAQATAITLKAELEGHARNVWQLWVYPAVETWPQDVALFGVPAGLDDLAESAARIDSLEAAPAVAVLCQAVPHGLEAFVRGGGCALILQWGEGPLASRACPFWRESIKLIEDHPIMDAVPHDGFADLQFYSLATDRALEPGALADFLPGVEIVPVLARLDARLFHYTHYLVEGRLGAGRVVASTLRFQGGMGDQPVGLRDNPASRHLLRRILAYLFIAVRM